MNTLKLKITSRSIYDELALRGIDVSVDEGLKAPLLTFMYNDRVRSIAGANPDISSATSVTIANNKRLTYALASRYTSIVVPATITYHDDTQAADFLRQYGRVVVKPVDGAHGNGVTTNVTDSATMTEAIETAKLHSDSQIILLQEFVTGLDMRVLVIDGECVGAVRREPASVTGDGVHTVQELIQIENSHNPDRGEVAYTAKMNKIDLGAVARYLGSDELQVVPKRGELTQVVGTANIGTGGRAVECLQALPKAMIRHATEIARVGGMFICGVDFLYDEDHGEWRLIEINSSPSFGLHMMPSEGVPIPDLAHHYIDKLLAIYNKS
ncbi:MAG: hypothetical protein WAU02_03445 [Candidatus Saccharimonadales bacterium]